MLFALSHALLPGYLRSGTTTEERERPLDGDAIIAHPTTGYTLAITIRASPEQVWPFEHGLLQPPQCALLLCVFTHEPPQDV